MIWSQFIKQVNQEEWSKVLWPDGYGLYRVVAATDTRRSSDRNPYHQQFILTTSSPCYCEPSVELWLAEDGLDDPDSVCVLLVPVSRKTKDGDENPFHIKFRLWDGWYEGYLEMGRQRLWWAGDQVVIGKIIDVASLTPL
jgi:hypothetical protein